MQRSLQGTRLQQLLQQRWTMLHTAYAGALIGVIVAAMVCAPMVLASRPQGRRAAAAGGPGQFGSPCVRPKRPRPKSLPCPKAEHLPVISGTAQEGQWLTASRGKWSARPNWFTYQWLICSASGRSCADLRGATGPRREVAAGDVGHALRVLVTAGNAAGFRKAASAATTAVSGRRVFLDAATQSGAVEPAPAPGPQETPPPGDTGEPPTASFVFAPAAPVVGEPVMFDGSGSTCPEGPCVYEWSDDGSEEQPIPALWPLGDGPTLLVAFPEPGVKYIRLTVTDAAGRSATVEHDVTVSPEAVVRPVNTALPAVIGSAVEGQSLSASTGTWTGSPASYAYQWGIATTPANVLEHRGSHEIQLQAGGGRGG